jgi:hypothetical protein
MRTWKRGGLEPSKAQIQVQPRSLILRELTALPIALLCTGGKYGVKVSHYSLYAPAKSSNNAEGPAVSFASVRVEWFVAAQVPCAAENAGSGEGKMVDGGPWSIGAWVSGCLGSHGPFCLVLIPGQFVWTSRCLIPASTEEYTPRDKKTLSGLTGYFDREREASCVATPHRRAV